jgi:hypothetical protein
MNNNKLSGFLGLMLAVTTQANADENDIAVLNAKVDQQIQQIEQAGLLPTSIEIETIKGDIVDIEVETTDTTVDEAAVKYELTPTLERYIKLKEAGRTQFSHGGGIIVPPE